MRRGLSPLVATIILIAFTVLGGIVIYEFFMKTSESMMVSAERLIVTATKSYYDNTRLVVNMDIVNGYRTNITITGFRYLTASSTTAPNVTPLYPESGSLGINLVPGAKYSVVLLVPVDTRVILVEYKARGQTLVETIPIG